MTFWMTNLLTALLLLPALAFASSGKNVSAEGQICNWHFKSDISRDDLEALKANPLRKKIIPQFDAETIKKIILRTDYSGSNHNLTYWFIEQVAFIWGQGHTAHERWAVFGDLLENQSARARDRSRAIDALLGYKEESLYRRVDRNYSAWAVGAAKEARSEKLFSPYSTLVKIVRALNPSRGQKFESIGSGIAREAVVLAKMAPETDYLGYELVPERIIEAQRVLTELGLEKKTRFIAGDIQTHQLEDADFYFMFNPFAGETEPEEYVFNELKRIHNSGKKFKLIYYEFDPLEYGSPVAPSARRISDALPFLIREQSIPNTVSKDGKWQRFFTIYKTKE